MTRPCSPDVEIMKIPSRSVQAPGIQSGQPAASPGVSQSWPAILLIGAFNQFHRCLPVVGVVADVLAHDALRFGGGGLGRLRRGQVKSGDLLVRAMWRSQGL